MYRLIIACAMLSMVKGDGTRVEFELSNFKNQGGILASGRKCDSGRGRHCDPLITATIDTETPNARWPGSKPVNTWTKVFEADETDSVAVNKIISKDICRGVMEIRGTMLRVNVVDQDGDHTTPIEQFECMCGRDVDYSESSSDWSAVKDCTALNNPGRVKLQYRCRSFNIPDRDCGQPIFDKPNPTFGRRTYYYN